MTTFAEGAERNLALGIWGSASGSGAAAGVLLGGILTSALSWPWIFFLNAPVGALLLVLTPRLLRESKGAADTRHFDLAGATSVTASIMLFVYALTHGAEQGWSDPVTLVLLAGSALLLAAFVAIERRAVAPLLPLRIFRVRTLAAANVVVVVVGSIAFSEFFLLTLYMQQVLGYSPLQTGAGFLAFALTVAVVSQVAQSAHDAVRGTPGARRGAPARRSAARVVRPATRDRALRHRRSARSSLNAIGMAPLLRPDDDRGPRRRRRADAGHRVRAHQHEPPARRRGRAWLW